MRKLIVAIGLLLGTAFAAWVKHPAGAYIMHAKTQEKETSDQLPKNQTPPKITCRLTIGKNIEIDLVPIEGDDPPLTSVSPITNAQFKVAVDEGAIKAPVLPVE